MHSSNSHQKYKSLIISLILHILLFLLFFMIKIHHPLSFHKDPLAERRTPAPVTLMPQTAQTPPILAPSQPPALPQAPPIIKPEPASLQTTQPAESQEQSNAFEESISTETTTIDEEQSQLSDHPVQKEQTAQFVRDARLTGRPGKRKRRKSSITGSAFMNALRQSLHADRKELRSNASNGNTHSHVHERIEDWAEANYIQSVIRAIKRATRFSSKYLNSEADINKSVVLEIPIEKDGRLGKMAEVITGIAEADEHLKNILKQADFPPLPKRFNKDRFIFKTMLHIFLKKGMNYGYISVN